MVSNRLVVARQKPGEFIVEGVEIGHALRLRATRHDFDVEKQFLFEQAHKVAEFEPGPRAEERQLLGGIFEPREPLWADLLELRVGSGGFSDEVESIDDGCRIIDGNGVPHPLLHVVTQLVLGDRAAQQPPRKIRECLQIARADRPARTREQPNEF